jgi:hypothetical protein
MKEVAPHECGVEWGGEWGGGVVAFPLHVEKISGYCTVKKGVGFSHSQPGCNQPNSPWPGIIELFPAR